MSSMVRQDFRNSLLLKFSTEFVTLSNWALRIILRIRKKTSWKNLLWIRINSQMNAIILTYSHWCIFQFQTTRFAIWTDSWIRKVLKCYTTYYIPHIICGISYANSHSIWPILYSLYNMGHIIWLICIIKTKLKKLQTSFPRLQYLNINGNPVCPLLINQ